MKITYKNSLVDNPGVKIVEIRVNAPDIAEKSMPGQFVVLMADKKGERLPLTIVKADRKSKEITLIFQEAGFSTALLGKMNVGDSLYALVGPLGHPTPIKCYGKVILVGGGVGIAEILPVAASLKREGNHITSILGARSKDMLILEEELKKASDEFYITTDDGSYGKKGFVTDILRQLLAQDKYNMVYAVGPIAMMKNVCAVTGEFAVKTLVSLNALMVDGTGMCGCCRVTIGGKLKFTCVDGPDFDGSIVDWSELEKRNRIYQCQEKHLCKLDRSVK